MSRKASEQPGRHSVASFRARVPPVHPDSESRIFDSDFSTSIVGWSGRGLSLRSQAAHAWPATRMPRQAALWQLRSGRVYYSIILAEY
jgi:hypothetical protein